MDLISISNQELLYETLPQEDPRLFKERSLTSSEKKTFKIFSESYSMTLVLKFLPQIQIIRLQQLSKFYYRVQIPRSLSNVEVKLRKIRLHLFNNDHIIIFNMQNFTKKKRYIQDAEFPHLWNCQTIEVKGQIYLTGGSVANTKTYVKTNYVLDEKTFRFVKLENMFHARDAHGVIGWKDQFMIVVGSWHIETSTKTVEKYDIMQDKWYSLPDLNYATCAPGLIIMEDRYLYKVGGTTNIRKIEKLDLYAPEENWITINTSNQIGKKQSINRCILHAINTQEFIVFGCHFGRSEFPFIYHTDKNNFQKFQTNEIQVDMYRSNDVVQLDQYSIFIRPFVKVGDSTENVKVLQYFIKNMEICEDEQDGPHISDKKNQSKISKFFRNVFSKHPRFSTKAFHTFSKGYIEDVEFATTEWESK